MIRPLRIIIIGGNASGPAAAAQAKRVNPEAEVIIYEASQYISTGTCEIPYVLSGDISKVDDIIKYDPASFYRDKQVKVYVYHLVEKIDPVKMILQVRNLKNNEIRDEKFDRLVIATGSVSKSLGFGSAENLCNFKTIDDLKKIDSFLKNNKVMEVTIIGAGYTGLEAAESFHKLNKNVTIIEKADLPLHRAESEIQQYISEKIKEKGVQFYTGSSLKATYNANKINSLNSDGRIIDTDMVISAIGFVPNTYLSDQMNMKKGLSGALKTDRRLKTKIDNIYAAGDIVELTDDILNIGSYVPLAHTAYNTGHVAGENAAGGNILMPNVIRNISLKVFDNYYTNVGLTSWEADENNLFYQSIKGSAYNYDSRISGSQKIFGKILYRKDNKQILGASFWGGRETEGYANLISALIKTKQSAELLSEINYNYTPPLSPMKNLLFSLGRKIISGANR